MPVRYDFVPKDRPILRPQARKHDPEYLARLADSLLKGQLQPIGLDQHFNIIWGTGRVLAARMKPEITHLAAAIFDEPITERAFQRMRFVENQLRQDLSNTEKCLNAIEYAKSEPNMALKAIADDLGVSAGMMTRWLAFEKTVESVRQALAANQITLVQMYSISQLPQTDQPAALVSALNGGKVRKKNGSAVKTARVKCQLPSGVLVTLAEEGDGLSLDTVIETLADLLKAARKANDEGLDAKTWERVLRDKANAG